MDDRPLTRRETEIMKLLASGKTVKDIATMFNLSTKTVDVHKNNIYRKLDIHRAALLTVYVFKKGFLAKP